MNLYAVEYRAKDADTEIDVLDGETPAYAMACQYLLERIEHGAPHWGDSPEDEEDQSILHLIAVTRFEDAVKLAQKRMKDYDDGAEEFIAVHQVGAPLKYFNADGLAFAERAMRLMLARGRSR